MNGAEADERITAAPAVLRMGFYPRWILANALAELVGLGATFGLGYVVGPAADAAGTAMAVVGAGLVMVVAGTLFEGVVVGLAQGWVLTDALGALALRDWVRATALGAFLAWLLGMIPSTIAQLTADPTAAAEAPAMVGGEVLVLAAVLGLVLGPILALPQWAVLRRHVARAGWWIAANAGAWAVGMMVVFAGAGALAEDGSRAGFAAVLLTSFLVAGAAVGTVHGAVLVRLLKAPGPPAQLH